MAKKKAARPGFQTTIRLTDAEQQAFARAAEFEGFGSIAAWMMDQARQRSAVIAAAIESGKYIEVRGRNIPLTDLPDDLRRR